MKIWEWADSCIKSQWLLSVQAAVQAAAETAVHTAVLQDKAAQAAGQMIDSAAVQQIEQVFVLIKDQEAGLTAVQAIVQKQAQAAAEATVQAIVQDIVREADRTAGHVS